MGTGTFADGKFKLIASFQYAADATRIKQWETAFQQASCLLFRATEGQMQIAEIRYGNNHAGESDADIVLMEKDCVNNSSSCASGTVRQQHCPGTFSLNPALQSTSLSYVFLFHDETRRPYIIVHEFGHYALCLVDEYSGTTPICAGNAAGEHSCIMEFPYTQGLQLNPDGTILSAGNVNQFCCRLNHHGTVAQSKGQLKSCWEMIASRYAEHNFKPLPVNERPGTRPIMTECGPLTWLPMGSTTQTMMIVESDSRNPAIEAAMSFATDVLSRLPDVTLLTFPERIAVPSVNGPKLKAVDGQKRLQAILAYFTNAPQVSRSNVIWVPGPTALNAEAGSDLGTQFRRMRVRIHSTIPSVAGGSRAFYELSRRTNGSLRVLTELPTQLDALQSGSQLLASAVESVEHFALLEHEPFHLPGATTDSGVRSSEMLRAGWQRGRTSPTRVELPALIESGAEMAVFGFLNRADDAVHHSLLLPSGKRVSIADVPDAAVVSQPQTGLNAVIVQKPQLGGWVLISERMNDCDDEVFGNLFCAVKNRQLQAVLSVDPAKDVFKVEIHVVVIADSQLIHLEPAFAVVEFLTVDGTWELKHTAPLLPQNPLGSSRCGDLTTTIKVDCAGTYRISTRLINAGNARGVPGEEPDVLRALDSITSSAPVFTRLLQKIVVID